MLSLGIGAATRSPCPEAAANSTQRWSNSDGFRSSVTSPPFHFGPSSLLWGVPPTLLNNLSSAEVPLVSRKEDSNIDKCGGHVPSWGAAARGGA